MTGKELFSKIILSLNSYLGFNDQYLIDLIDLDENLEYGIRYFLSLTSPPVFEKFVRSLDQIRQNNNGDFINNHYSIIGNQAKIDFNQLKFKNRIRRFAYSNTEYGFVATSALFDNSDLIDLSLIENELIWKQIEEYLERCYSTADNSLVTEFFDLLNTQNKTTGLVINKSGNPFDEDKHYPYIYLSFLNESKSIILENDLKYSINNIYPALTYDNTKDYEQYFDIYDVLNELNQSKDILNRFLRLYHTFEYLVYRVYLVDLVNRVGSSRIFVREFINSAESMKKGEKESFKKNFNKIFSPDLVPTIHPALTEVTNDSVITFLKDKKIVNEFNPNCINKIAEFIYGIRCCIVHNKESEYHISISKSDDFIEIIPLIRKTLETFERLVIKKIADNYNEIKYEKNTVQLY
jgi:hypothetical protein